MIIYRQWDTHALIQGDVAVSLGVKQVCDGWFLFGIVPSYIRKRFPA